MSGPLTDRDKEVLEKVAPMRLATEADPRVVERLKELLAMAESGELRHLSFIAMLTGAKVWEGHAGYAPDRYALAGMWLAQACNHARGF